MLKAKMLIYKNLLQMCQPNNLFTGSTGIKIKLAIAKLKVRFWIGSSYPHRIERYFQENFILYINGVHTKDLDIIFGPFLK